MNYFDNKIKSKVLSDLEFASATLADNKSTSLDRYHALKLIEGCREILSLCDTWTDQESDVQKEVAA